MAFALDESSFDVIPDSDYDKLATIPIEVEAVDETAPSITFKFWRAGDYKIYRKAPNALEWGSLYASTPEGSRSWTIRISLSAWSMSTALFLRMQRM